MQFLFLGIESHRTGTADYIQERPFPRRFLTDIWSISTIFTLMMRRDSVDSDDIQAFERMNPLTDDRIKVVFLPDIVASVREYLNPCLRKEIQRLLEI